MRGARLKHTFLLLAILAGGMLLAAQVPLHDFAAPVAHHADLGGHDSSHHEHPARAMALIAFFVLLFVIAFVTPSILPRVSLEARSFAGLLRCDDDVGLHAVLSVYRI